MSTRRHTRIVWAIFAVAMVMYVATLALTILNGSFSDPFLYFAVVMVAGYTTVGAVVSSRRPDNAVGWVLLFIGISFLLGGFGDEYVRYGHVTNPGSLPFTTAVAWLMNWTWSVAAGGILLMVVLYPTGRSHARGWRFLPVAIVSVSVASALGFIVSPGPVEIDPPLPLTNPTGIEAIPPRVIEIGETAIGFMLAALALLSVAALVHRYRRSSSEERQQLRLFVYAVTIAVFLMLGATTAGALFRNDLLSEAMFFAFFAVVGIGVPSTIGVAMLRYRLLDVDVVVRKTVVYGMFAVFFAAVLLFAAGLVGIVAGTTGRVAFALVAFTIGVLTVPIWRLARRIADRVVFGGRASPYELLARFGQRMAESYPTGDVLPRLAEVLAAATGATRGEVWIHLGAELRSAGVWPEEAHPGAPLSYTDDRLPAFPEPDHAIEVRHQGELLGALSVRMPPNDPMNAAKEQLVRDLARQAGLVLRNVRLIEELRASRTRLVAAQDEERRRLERNIHDGAQQQLVALAVNLKLARTLAARDPARAAEMLERLQGDTQQALEDLRDLARGIYPPLLADKGLAAALEAQARKAPLPVQVVPNGVGRCAQEVEAAIYFCVLEALQNTAKYAEASRVVVRLGQENGHVRFEVEDDGKGFDVRQTVQGAGLTNMRDRVEALGGSLEVRSAPGAGTTVSGRLPIDAIEAAP